VYECRDHPGVRGDPSYLHAPTEFGERTDAELLHALGDRKVRAGRNRSCRVAFGRLRIRHRRLSHVD
jgi:hypothetical protein